MRALSRLFKNVTTYEWMTVIIAIGTGMFCCFLGFVISTALAWLK
jgi:hypothetical protein